MIRTVVLPSSVDGIVTGCILAIGRIVGESAALPWRQTAAELVLSGVGIIIVNRPQRMPRSTGA